MKLANHIANYILTSKDIDFQVAKHLLPETTRKVREGIELTEEEQYKLYGLTELVKVQRHPIYVVTETVMDKLDMLKVKKNKDGEFDWTVFKDAKKGKYSFILPYDPDGVFDYGGVLRVEINPKFLVFIHMAASKTDSPLQVKMDVVSFYIELANNRHSNNAKTKNAQEIYDFCYLILCFVFLSENTYEIIEAGHRYGTRKKGKIVNDLPFPVTVINSKWNITSIRTDGFLVSGHFRLAKVGPGRSETKMIYIEPFEKHGYIRRAKSETL